MAEHPIPQSFLATPQILDMVVPGEQVNPQTSHTCYQNQPEASVGHPPCLYSTRWRRRTKGRTDREHVEAGCPGWGGSQESGRRRRFNRRHKVQWPLRHTPACALGWAAALGISVRTHQMCSGWENLSCGCAQFPSCRNNAAAECTALGQTAVGREDWAQELRIPSFEITHHCCHRGWGGAQLA